MSFVGSLRFAVKCFNALAWPLCSLGYPLCASFSAIEANSSEDIQNLVTYWVSFSLISLFDHAFAKLLYWNPFWPYMKLLAICWLTMPHFEGSLYVYKHVVHRVVSETPELVMNWLSAWKEIFLPKEDFLVVAERYIEENGAEALEKLIAKKPECKEPSTAQKEIKKVEMTEKKEADAAKWVNIPEVSLSHTENKVNAAAVSKEASAAEAVAVAVKENKLPEVSTIKTVGKEASAAVSVAVEENKLPEVPAIKTVQKEWTCALCQVTTPSETDLHDHCKGRKHKAKHVQLKATKEAAKNKESWASVVTNSDQPNQPTLRCGICDVTCSSFQDLVSHLNGRKHLANVQELNASVASVVVPSSDYIDTT